MRYQEAEQSTEKTRKIVCVRLGRSRPPQSSLVHCSDLGSEWGEEKMETARVDYWEKSDEKEESAVV